MFNVQVHIDMGNEPPETMKLLSGTVVVHERTAFEKSVYSYTVSADKWTKLPECKFQLFGLAVVKGKLTTIGGIMGYDATIY